jgi:hypothetical protein
MRYESYLRKLKKRNNSDLSQRISRQNQGKKAIDDLLFEVSIFTTWLALAHAQYAGCCQMLLLHMTSLALLESN